MSGQAPLYLDHAATTPTLPEVRELLSRLFALPAGNAASPHTPGRHAAGLLEDARARAAGLLGARPPELLFTSGGTESNHLAIRGAARARRAAGHGSHVVTQATEHASVLRAFAALATDGFEVTVLPVRPDGTLDPASLGRALTARTVLVSIMHANNETGVIQDVAELAALTRSLAPAARFHVDAVQTAGSLGWTVASLGSPDLVTFTAHKLGGPVGVGALLVREETALEPLMGGGRQERGLRAGTQPVALACGLARALELAHRGEDGRRALAASREALEAALLQRIPGVRVNGGGAPRLPGHLNVSIEGLSGEALVLALDDEGIAASTGAACSTGEVGSSHVLRAMGLGERLARGSVRFSLGEPLSAGERSRVVESLAAAVERLRRVAGGPPRHG